MQDQSKSIAAVQALLEEYVEAVRNGDRKRLEALFHPDARMNGYYFGVCVLGTPEPFLAHTADNPSQVELGANYQVRTLSISVYGRVATAIIAETGMAVFSQEGKRATMDIFDSMHLIEIDGRWQIIGKLYHHDEPRSA